MTEEALSAPQAFIIVDGKRVIPLDQPVTNLGRKAENHIVIADEHVSRYHAQIRRIRNRYLLMDLQSTVGTSVNGKKIDQVFLKAGDVISLGGVPVIFGLGTPDLDLADPATGPHAVPTGPTDATDLQQVDRYLDLFNTPEEE
ncbi:MAG: FHA domain-containing protein [Anaerolineales bacterium]|nr:FHA domain-containing protein [Anaerolineales bacterium]